MANKVYNMDGGLHSSAALGGLEDAMYGTSVANSDSFKVTAGTGMNVSIATGDGLISTGTGFARRIATDAVNTVAISAASTANPRIDSIVAYIDNAITPVQTVLNNTNGILNFAAVAGSPAANPTAPSAGAIQSAVGAGNPYMVLYNVTVPANATSLTAATFTDMRNIANIVSTTDIADDSITSDKIDWTDLQPTKTTETTTGSINLTWQKRTHKDGRITYDAAGSASWWTGAGTWSGDTYITLPVAFNASTMSCTVNAIGNDAAITVWGCAQAGSATLPIYRVNHYTQDITTNVSVCCHLEVYPS